MHVVRVRAEVLTGCLRDIGEFLVFTGCNGLDITILACLFEGLFCKVACDDIVRFAVFQKIQRHGLKLS